MSSYVSGFFLPAEPGKRFESVDAVLRDCRPDKYGFERGSWRGASPITEPGYDLYRKVWRPASVRKLRGTRLPVERGFDIAWRRTTLRIMSTATTELVTVADDRAMPEGPPYY